ncbi:MAG: hypothetical protein ACXVDA_12660, partial [Ktedonobacterales bacterium]
GERASGEVSCSFGVARVVALVLPWTTEHPLLTRVAREYGLAGTFRDGDDGAGHLVVAVQERRAACA